jgi:hypothetical protein
MNANLNATSQLDIISYFKSCALINEYSRNAVSAHIATNTHIAGKVKESSRPTVQSRNKMT